MGVCVSDFVIVALSRSQGEKERAKEDDGFVETHLCWEQGTVVVKTGESRLRSLETVEVERTLFVYF